MASAYHAPLSSDAPIRRRDEDLFDRARLAERIAVEARIAGDDAGFVIALCGAWGTGKTSIGNMVADTVGAEGDDVVISFNPWMFTGAEDLVGRFFGELAAALGKGEGKLRDVAAHVRRYARALAGIAGFVPGVGGTAASLLDAAENVAAAAGEGATLDERRAELVDALNELDGRIIVFIDDLDRLTDAEIREIVRLVKLVGDLPHITYVLSFDRQRVEEALGAPEVDADRARDRGRAYLEKIVQSRHDVPPLRPSTAIRFLLGQVEAALAHCGVTYDNEADWANMLGLALRHMVHTPRDARRIANALPAAVELYGDEVALVDLFGLEALRVLEPDVHAALPGVAEILVDDRHVIGGKDSDSDKARIDELVASARHPKAVLRLLGQLFPRAQPAIADVRGRHEERTERRNKRVAVPSVFRTYLHLALDDDTLAAPALERLAGLLGDPDALRVALEDTPDALLADALARLLDFKDQFRPEGALAAARVLMALEPRLPPDESPMFTMRTPSSWNLRSLVGHLLLSEPDPDKRAALATRLVEDAPDLSTRMHAVNWFGTHPSRDTKDPDSEMIPEADTTRLLDDLRARVLAASPAELASERMTTTLISGLLHPDEHAGRVAIRDKAADDVLMLKLLTSHYGDQKSQALGEAAVRRVPRLAWQQLAALLGEDHLRERVLALDAAIDHEKLGDDERAALTLGMQIARGETKPSID